MREITYAEAIREAMSHEMRKDKEVFLMGEDIGIYGGAFGVSHGMLEEFGEERLRASALEHGDLSLPALFAALYHDACEFGDGHALEDDVCLVGVRVNS